MYAVEFEGITKEFPGIIANKDISFRVKKGTIHALIGENGAGKSTLMSILFGLYSPTRGRIRINEQYVNIKGPNMANDLGIGMVHQHFKLVGIYSNLQNIILGSEFTNRHHFLDNNTAKLKIESIQKQFNLKFNLQEQSGKSSVPVQQKVEIMKMLYRDNEILIFDEPTAVLTDQEIDGLLDTMKLFKEQGKTVIFITHKLKEVKKVADTATILRLGEVVLNCDIKDTSIDQMAEAMVGGHFVESKNTNHKFDKANKVLEIKNVTTKSKHPLKNINLSVHKGEILAVAGIEGNGQTELEYLVSGLEKTVSGSINLFTVFHTQNVLKSKCPDTEVDTDEKFKSYAINQVKNSIKKLKGDEIFETFITKDKNKNTVCVVKVKGIVDITKLNVWKRSKLNLSYVPTDRHKHGLILDFNVNMNLVLRRLWDKTYKFLDIFKTQVIQEKTQKIIEDYDIRGARNGLSLSRSMSGGNQQKFIVGREMSHDHEFIIVMQPTRGLDVGAIKNIHERLLKEKAAGKGILLISYELDEVLALADTIAIINDYKIVKTSPIDEITRKEIGLYMTATDSKTEEVNNE